MQKRVIIVVNAIILVMIIVALLFILLQYSSYSPVEDDNEECMDINHLSSFVYDLCYDAETKKIFIELTRAYDIYHVKNINFSFFDYELQSHFLSNVPEINETKKYKIHAEKKPEKLDIYLDVRKDFSSQICKTPRSIQVKYCQEKPKQVDVEISETGEIITEDDPEKTIKPVTSDTLDLSLVEKRRIWESKCKSSWRCEPWGMCENDVQKRECTDIN